MLPRPQNDICEIQPGKEKDMIATKSTEEHEKITIKAFIFPCSSVGFVAIKEFATQGVIPATVVISLKDT